MEQCRLNRTATVNGNFRNSPPAQFAWQVIPNDVQTPQQAAINYRDQETVGNETQLHIFSLIYWL